MTEASPPRSVGETVLVVITAMMALISLLVPPLPPDAFESGGHLTPLIAGPFLTPVAGASDVFALVVICLVLLGLLLPPVLVIRAVVGRRSGRLARGVTLFGGVGVVFWGFFVFSFALSPLHPLSLVASIATLLAGILLLVAQYVVLKPRLPRRG